MTDTFDLVLNQAIVCAYAVPVAGPIAAAGLSIMEALYDSLRPDDVTAATYTVSMAITDLGNKIGADLKARDEKGVLDTAASWQLDLDDAKSASPHFALKAAGDFVADRTFHDTFAKFPTTAASTPLERVETLGDFFTVRSSFHSLCQVWLDKLEAARSLDHTTVADLTTEIHRRYVKSLTDSLDYARATVDKIDDVYRHARDRANAKADADAPDTGFDRGLRTPPVLAQQRRHTVAMTHELRRIAAENHLEQVSRSTLKKWQTFIAAYDTTLTGQTATSVSTPSVKAPPVNSAPVISTPGRDNEPGTAAPVEVVAVGSPIHVSETRTLTTFGPRGPGVARFLFESDPAGGWVNVVGDSTVSPGPLVVQDAGSTLPGIYYRIGGDTLNGEFADQLAKADPRVLVDANADLRAAYETRWPGDYDTDAAGTPPRTDRLTSFLIMLAPDVPPIGAWTYGVLYSVGPQLGAGGITDPEGYKKVYTDGLDAIAAWNRANPSITNLRIALLSTGAFAGQSAGPALRAQAAGLVIDAVVAAMKAEPALATLTILVNTNDSATASGDERIAFTTAASARKIQTYAQGFDVPLS